MKKYNVTASLFLDAIISFSIITTICLVFLPMLLQLNQATKEKLSEIEMKRILLLSLHNYSEPELKRGLILDEYSLTLKENKICIIKRETKNGICYYKKIKAFTYIEVLFALMITVLLLTIIPSLFKSTTALSVLANDHLNIESEFFARDLTQDLMNNKGDIMIDKSKGTQLSIKDKNKLISYSFKNNKIVKSINGKGNITLLNNVKAIK
ncbi:competence type IV pilus minor pilin ComGF, partial [Staphylococcus equorum]